MPKYNMFSDQYQEPFIEGLHKLRKILNDWMLPDYLDDYGEQNSIYIDSWSGHTGASMRMEMKWVIVPTSISPNGLVFID
ncbi:MAG: hypothetical protein NT091_01340 [Candidatus Falkowbacteria bacterium]|nr:hypothetical protein [Candidatus Falkowbacteria bacterium]